MSKKVLILSGSPRKGGNSDLLCDEFARGAEKAGHLVEKIHVQDLKIGGCLACYGCREKHVCVQKDDMSKVLETLKDADMVVFASPIYWFDITAQLKTVIDRLYACGSTGFHFNKTALLLNAGADHVFDAAIAQYKAMTSYLKWEDKGIITAPNMVEKGTMKECPELEKVKELAKNL